MEGTRSRRPKQVNGLSPRSTTNPTPAPVPFDSGEPTRWASSSGRREPVLRRGRPGHRARRGPARPRGPGGNHRGRPGQGSEVPRRPRRAARRRHPHQQPVGPVPLARNNLGRPYCPSWTARPTICPSPPSPSTTSAAPRPSRVTSKTTRTAPSIWWPALRTPRSAAGASPDGEQRSRTPGCRHCAPRIPPSGTRAAGPRRREGCSPDDSPRPEARHDAPPCAGGVRHRGRCSEPFTAPSP